MQIINHYSMIISFIFILILTAFFLMRDGAVTKDYYILAALAVVLFAAWQVLRPAKETAETTSQLESALGGGQPVLLELQSPF
ncbi:MAG: hypothetical protein IMY76_05990 [Chloroflexi bacterium]|nr:hypothetical protein [Chloroflexota bacterium]